MLRLLLSFKFAIRGVLILLKTEKNFKIHILASILVVSFGFFFNISTFEWIGILICIALVISAEAINSAIEKIIDLISPNYNEKAGEIKDISAGAVLITALIAVLIGGIIFFPKIICLF